MMLRPRMLALLVVPVIGLACQAPPQPAAPTEVLVRLEDYDAFVDATLTILREQHFEPRRLNRAAGEIEAGPATGQQWFEFWRADSPGGYQLLESSLHTMRRDVVVTVAALDRPAPTEIAAPVPSTTVATSSGVSPAGAEMISETSATTRTARANTSGVATEFAESLDQPTSGRYRLGVRVDKSRYSAPERQVTTASGALAIYSERLPTAEGLRGAASRSNQWTPLGRDELLESYLLDLFTRAPQIEILSDAGL